LSNSKTKYIANKIQDSPGESLAMSLLLHKQSFRKVQTKLKIIYGLEVSHDTVFRYYHQFVKPVEFEIARRVRKHFEDLH